MNHLARMLSVAALGVALCTGAQAGDAVVTPAQIAAAKTPADHEAIAVAYEQEATSLETKAKEHDAMAKAYSSGGSSKTGSASMHAHCAKLAKQYTEAAKENRELAKEHRSMAHWKALEEPGRSRTRFLSADSVRLHVAGLAPGRATRCN
jgi:hypothetical protein